MMFWFRCSAATAAIHGLHIEPRISGGLGLREGVVERALRIRDQLRSVGGGVGVVEHA
jgi:hypothetical protein